VDSEQRLISLFQDMVLNFNGFVTILCRIIETGFLVFGTNCNLTKSKDTKIIYPAKKDCRNLVIKSVISSHV